MVKIDEERRRLIISLLLTLFFMAFILINVTYKAGFIYLVLNMISLIVVIFWEQLPKKKPNRKMFSFEKDWWLDLLIGIGIGAGILLLMSILPGFVIATPSMPSAAAFPEPLATAGQWITVVGAAPLVEEIAFRSVLFAIFFIVIGLSFFWSSLIDSAVFSLYHINSYAGEIAINPILAVSGAFISAFLISMLICYVNRWRGSVSTGMGVHGTINGGITATQFVFVS